MKTNLKLIFIFRLIEIMNFNVLRIFFGILALYSIINVSSQTQGYEKSDLLLLNADAPPIRSPLRLGKREDQRLTLKPKFLDVLRELKWISSHWKKKKRYCPNIITMFEVFSKQMNSK
jgi:hypothetical protein